jgi:hypothetical protein
MLKLTSLALGLLTVIAIAPKSEAMSATTSPLSLQTPAGNLHSQVIIKLGGQSERDDRHDRGEAYRRRELELEREREAARRRHQVREHHDRYRDNDYRYHR